MDATTRPASRRAARAALAAAAVLLACAFAFAAAAPAAFGKTMEAPLGVSDDITRIHVDKVDARTHEAVVGATMQIIVEETGEVVDEWVTDGTTHMFDKGLDVNVRYILREAAAPEGYKAAEDTVFIANETEGTGLTLVDAGGGVELSGLYTVTVYEPHEELVVDEERVEYTYRTVPRTGDASPVVPAAVAAVIAAAVVAIAVVARRKNR